MVCNVLTPFVSLVQSTLKVMPNFGSTTKGSVPPSSDGTTMVTTHEIVAMKSRCLCHPGNHFQVPVRRGESPQSRQKTHQWTLNHWTRQHHRHLVFKAPSKTTSREMAHHCSAGGNGVPSSRMLDKSFSSDSLWRLRYSFSTKAHSILTLRSAPFTSTIPVMGNIRLSTKDS